MPIFESDVVCQRNIQVGGTIGPPRPRSELAMDELQEFPLDATGWQVHDDGGPLPTAAAADDLGLVSGAFGTAPITVQAGDLKAAGATTRYARRQIPLPPEYQAGNDVRIRFAAGMLTTIADGSATLDVEVYKHDEDNTVTGDLYTGAAKDINSVTFADQDFALTASGLYPGDVLDVRIAVAVSDGATATAVIACIDCTKLVCDIKG